MKIITIGNQKGGVGKSTIACNLAVQAVAGGRRTLLIDADLEASSMDFRAIRAEKENLPQFSAVAIIKDSIRHDVRSFNGFDVALIDVGGFDGKVFRSAIMAADLFLIPVLPSLYDVWSTQETIEILKEIQAVQSIDARLVVNQMIPETKIAKEVSEALDNLGVKRLKTVLHHSTAYKRSIGEGVGITEFSNSDGKASEEIKSLWKEVLLSV